MSEGRRGPGLGLKILLVVLPVVLSALLIISSLAGMMASHGVDRALRQLLAYKADDLVRYTDSQWELLVSNRLLDDPAYLESARDSIRSYALTIKRSDSEWIVAIDPDGALVFSAGSPVLQGEDIDLLRGFGGAEGSDGWFESSLAGVERVGYTFWVSAFGWRAFITEEREVYYGEVILMRKRIAIILIAVLAATGLFIVLLVRHSLSPLKIMLAEMRRIVEERKFGVAVVASVDDEVGDLAGEFNVMTAHLDRTWTRLKEINLREVMARKDVVAHQQEALELLGRAADYRDPETGKHVRRVGHYAALLATLRGEEKDSIDLLRSASPLHDVGKLGLRDSILKSRKRYSAKEREEMEGHTLIGYRILMDSANPYMRAGAEIALTHHERWDGSGYPRGLKGQEIPFFGRVTGLVDVFDALTTARPYKEPWELNRAVEWVTDSRETHFDPELVDLFLKGIDTIQAIMQEHSDKGDETEGESA